MPMKDRTKLAIYKIWHGMISRCYDKSHAAYRNYGYRGIKVHPVWIHSFEAFYCWAINHGYMKGLSLERDNNNGNYEPGNCSWQGKSNQNHNRRKKIGTSSKFIGVCYVTLEGTNKHWRAEIIKDGIKYSLGYFYTETEAAEAYNKRAKVLYGERARLNLVA